MKNILNVFEKELGLVCNTNQYVELSMRLIQKSCSIGLDNAELLKVIARGNGLSITSYTSDVFQNVFFCYLTMIHSCFQDFLKSYEKLVGSEVYGKTYNNRDDMGHLKWIVREMKNDPDSLEKDAINICEYYRLLRNDFIHSGEENSRLKTAYSMLTNVAEAFKKSKMSHTLNAPNGVGCLNYDDQVLFSRATIIVAKLALHQHVWVASPPFFVDFRLN
ncbi:hypothetical protein [Fibrobacter sp. HC4]|uniref:hypothetical protein n=1 Tax=Fibrobacter sp. HC4 TaxID=3239812 RepID=UPI002019E490|nr:hypothetical protein [Fibrobacter succinogenes]MCL4103049.1 hypothetical protein [Fibrobacter succinogenes]